MFQRHMIEAYLSYYYSEIEGIRAVISVVTLLTTGIALAFWLANPCLGLLLLLLGLCILLWNLFLSFLLCRRGRTFFHHMQAPLMVDDPLSCLVLFQ